MLSIEIAEIVVSLSVIVKVLFISFGSACIMYSLEIGKMEGMLLEKYGKWLNKEKNFNNGQFRVNYDLGTIDDSENPKPTKKQPKYKKVLGGCGVCTSFWIGAIIGFALLGVNAFFVPFITVYIYQKL